MSASTCCATIAGVVEMQEQQRCVDREERSRLLAAKQRRPSARSYLDWQAGSDAHSDGSGSEGMSHEALASRP